LGGVKEGGGRGEDQFKTISSPHPKDKRGFALKKVVPKATKARMKAVLKVFNSIAEF
jgi:hypothetical protein